MYNVIILEGAEGVGKTTIAKELIKKDERFVYFREPGSSPIAEAIRELIFKYGENANQNTLIYLFTAARNEVFNQIDKELEKGKIIILDRSVLTSMAIQKQLTLPLNLFNNIINSMKNKPKIKFYVFTTPDEIIEKRLSIRKNQDKFFNKKALEHQEEYKRIYEINRATNFLNFPIEKIETINSEKTADLIYNKIIGGDNNE